MTTIYKWTPGGRRIKPEDWNTLVDVLESEIPKTVPEDGTYKVTNLYVVVENGNPKLKIEYDDGE